MPFRARMKRALTRTLSGSSDGSNSLPKPEPRGIGDPKIYQPGEPMPRPKYRAPVDKKHKAMLESFSFDNPSRRKSTSSDVDSYSPMGSRIPSRRNSVNRRPSWWASSTVEQLVENIEDDASGLNIGPVPRALSREMPMAKRLDTDDSIVKTDSQGHIETSDSSSTTSALDHTPFSEADINDALTRSLPVN